MLSVKSTAWFKSLTAELFLQHFYDNAGINFKNHGFTIPYVALSDLLKWCNIRVDCVYLFKRISDSSFAIKLHICEHIAILRQFNS